MKNRTMITFDKGKSRFSFRSVAVIIENGYILVHKSGEQDFWSLPGGRVELGETAEDAVIREMKEEIEETVGINRLLWVVENFFENENMDCHELSLFFLLSVKEKNMIDSKGMEFSGIDNNVPLFFKWFPIEMLENVQLYPTFLRTRLLKLPATTVYFKHEDN